MEETLAVYPLRAVQRVSRPPPSAAGVESRPSVIGHITLDTKRAGKRSAANPHAAFDEAGTGNGTMGRTETPAAGESRRQTATPHSYRDCASSRPYRQTPSWEYKNIALGLLTSST